MQSAKITDTTYNDTTYIDKEIIKNDMVVSGDIVFVDGWQFEIDRSVPQNKTSLGRGEKRRNNRNKYRKHSNKRLCKSKCSNRNKL